MCGCAAGFHQFQKFSDIAIPQGKGKKQLGNGMEIRAVPTQQEWRRGLVKTSDGTQGGPKFLETCHRGKIIPDATNHHQ